MFASGYADIAQVETVAAGAPIIRKPFSIEVLNAAIARAGEEITAALRRGAEPGEGTPPGGEMVRAGFEALRRGFDPVHGGFGGAPKFPQPSIPSFVLRAAQRFGDNAATKMVLHTCDRMNAGGIHDQLGGGFARYSVDAEWLV